MILRLKLAFVPIACLSIAACATGPTPIIVVAADDIGVVAGVTPQSQGAALTVGYKGAKFAVLPVESQDGKLLGLRSATGKETDTYSIFTELGLEVKGGPSSGVAVAQVLAVGEAADKWVARRVAPAGQKK